MSRVQIAPDKTRLAVSITSDTYQRLSDRCGRKFGEYVDSAIREKIERDAHRKLFTASR